MGMLDWFEKHDAGMLSLLTKEYALGVSTFPGVDDPVTKGFRFRALKTGSTTITFVNRRPWEAIPFRQSVFYIEIK